MNTKLLLKIKSQILKEPKQFQMRYGFACRLLKDVRRFDMGTRRTKIPNCGTAACIAGWGKCIELGLNPAGALLSLSGGLDWKLTETQKARLFYFDNWPSKFQRHTCEGTPAFAKQAALRIDHFIATKGTE